MITLTANPQSTSIDFHSPENTKKFADYLFCEGDYLRAIEEYTSIRNIFQSDTVNFKIMMGYSRLNLYRQVIDSYLDENFSEFRVDAQMLYLKNEFLLDSSVFHSELSDTLFPFEMDLSVENYFLKLRSFYLIKTRSNETNKEVLLEPFNTLQQEEVEPFIDLSTNPPYKSPALAGILSAVIPGSGKMYSRGMG